MRMNRTITAALCAILALCLTVLPSEALAASHVTINGVSVTASLPYYKNGAIFATDPGDWTAWFTSNALQLRNISQSYTANQGIEVVGGGPYSFLLVGNANSYALTALSNQSAIIGDAIVFTGSGALSVRSGSDSTSRYGIEATTSITLQGGASLTAAGHLGATNRPVAASDWSQYTITADTDPSGTNAIPVTPTVYQANCATYHYVRFAAIPQPVPQPGGGASGVPKTGDETPLALLFGLMLLAGTALIAIRRKSV